MKRATLKTTRRAAGLTQEQVAANAGVTTRMYQEYERDKRTPSVVTAIKIADALGVCDLRELWGNAPEQIIPYG